MIFRNGSVQCVNEAFVLQASSNGVPSLSLENSVVQDTGAAVWALAGNATISSSTIEYNFYGVWQDSDGTNVGTIDLSGGDAGGMNTVACNRSEGESPPGCSVLNSTSKVLNASNVNWDTPGPDVFLCFALPWSVSSCNCRSPDQCVAAPGSNGMDAVNISTGTIQTKGHGMAAITRP